MTIEELMQQCEECIKLGRMQPTDQVKFRTNIIPSECRGRDYSSCEVDYILLGQEPDSIILCWDDGEH